MERLYENWVEEVAKNELFLPSPSRTNMKRLVTNMEKVQALRLDRVELRACNIGAYTTSMSKLKQLFGCNQLLAPTVSTFYLKGMPVTTLNIFDRRYIAEHRVGNFRPPGPIGKTVKDPTDYVMDVVKKNPGTRSSGTISSGISPRKIRTQPQIAMTEDHHHQDAPRLRHARRGIEALLLPRFRCHLERTPNTTRNGTMRRSSSTITSCRMPAISKDR